ncbi:mobilization protein [Bifidobacterium breve]|nr:mobilization protein [Bifidobacterium breve]
MPIEEQAEEKIQNVVQTVITGGAKLMLRIPKGVAMALLRSGMKLAKTGVHAAGAAVKDGIDSGEMSEKRLQRKKDGDLHELQLDDSTMREVQHSLKQAGIDYHLERTDQGQFILHFAGRDEDHVRHAVQRAFKNMGLDIADEDFTVEQTEQQERTTEQTRNEPETPTRETTVEPAAKPLPTQRIAWDFVDPEVMEMAANSLAARHPELSWDKLMGDTTCDEQTGRDFADRIIGKAAATRACATSSTPSCATTTGRARKPRSRTVRRRPSQAGRRRQRSRKTNRNPRRPRPGRRPSNSRHRPEQTIPGRPARSGSRSRSGRRRHCSNGSRPGSTRTSPSRRTTCHPPRTGTARPARAAERKPQ